MSKSSLIAVLLMISDLGSRMMLNTEQSDEQILFGKLDDISFYLEEECDHGVAVKLCISRPSDDLLKLTTQAYGRVPNIRYRDDGICFEWIMDPDADDGSIEDRMDYLKKMGAETIIKLRVNDTDVTGN